MRRDGEREKEREVGEKDTYGLMERGRERERVGRERHILFNGREVEREREREMKKESERERNIHIEEETEKEYETERERERKKERKNYSKVFKISLFVRLITNCNKVFYNSL